MAPGDGELEGCNLDDADYLVTEPGPPAGFGVTVTFPETCGAGLNAIGVENKTDLCVFPSIVKAEGDFYIRAEILCSAGASTDEDGGGNDASTAEAEMLPTLNLSMGDNFFRPETLTIQARQKYRLDLVNTGQATHDIWGAGSDGQTSTGDDYRSDPIPGGGSANVKIKYDNPGTYYYVCTFHAGMGGSFIVK